MLITAHKKNTRNTIHRIFVTSLAVADLVFLCFDSFFSMLGMFGITSGAFNCRVSLTIVTIGYNAGLFTITSMAIHRCHIVTHPWRPKLKRRGAFIWVSLIWLAAFSLVIPLIVVNKPTGSGCEEVWPTFGHRRAYTASLMTIQYIIPLLVTVICYVQIWLFLKKRPVLPNNSGLNSVRNAPGEENARESIAILKTVAVIVLLFLILLLPTQVAWMLLDFRNISSKELWFASEMLTRLHSCLNPVVYGVMNKQYRRSYVTFLSRMSCCRHSSRVEQEPPQMPMGHRIASQEVCNDDQDQQMSQHVENNADSLVTERHS